jgi:hypothetical protein
MFDQHLVHAIIGGKHPHRCSPELGLNSGLAFGVPTRDHKSLSFTRPSCSSSRKLCLT